MSRFTHRVHLPISPRDLFAWHARPGAFERLTPPWDEARVRKAMHVLEAGSVADFDVAVGPIRLRWVARHEEVFVGGEHDPAGFVDVMKEGPFRSWRHHHSFAPDGAGGCILTDTVDYQLPRIPFASWFSPALVEKRLQRMFAFRARTLRGDISFAQKFPSSPQKIAVSGASGLVGQEICTLLSVLGHDVKRLVRHRKNIDDEIIWNPKTGDVDPVAADGLDAVLHLAGENIGEGRFTKDKAARLHQERAGQASALFRALAKLPHPPSVVVGACATGFYGDRGEEVVDEDSAAGVGVLPDICRAWENALLTDYGAGWRSVSVRSGVVLSPRGGMLKKLLPAFRAGFGASLGNGRAFMPLIGADDAADVYLHALFNARITGAVNACLPQAVRNQEFTDMLASALHRKAWMRVPAPALRLAFGPLTDEVLLASTRATSKKLLSLGREWRHADVPSTLAHVLGTAVL